jgi:hypothetical protein
MDTFSFPYHTPTHTYPRGDAVQFGRGYQFNAKPQLPFQRTFRLHFNAMKWFLNTDGTVDRTTHPEYNMQCLLDFFEAHDTSQAFIYPHPIYGNLTVKFSSDQQVEVPATIESSTGNGVTEAFDLFVVEQPL